MRGASRPLKDAGAAAVIVGHSEKRGPRLPDVGGGQFDGARLLAADFDAVLPRVPEQLFAPA